MFIDRIPTHRLVLCAANDFFDRLLTSPLEENKNEFVIEKIRGETLRAVIHFFYTGTIEIDADNAEFVMAAASFFLLPQLQQKCVDYFVQSGVIDASNCVGIWLMAGRYAFEDLKAAASEVLFENFLEATKSDEFLRLDTAIVTEILENDIMNVSSEEDVFNALIGWVQFDLNERKILLPDLIRVVRVRLLKDSVSLETNAL